MSKQMQLIVMGGLVAVVALLAILFFQNKTAGSGNTGAGPQPTSSI